MVHQNNLLDEILNKTFSELRDKDEFDDILIENLSNKIREMNQEAKFNWEILLNILNGEDNENLKP